MEDTRKGGAGSPEMTDAVACSNATPYPGPDGHSEDADSSGELRVENTTAKAYTTPEDAGENRSAAIPLGPFLSHDDSKRPHITSYDEARPLALGINNLDGSQIQSSAGQGGNVIASNNKEQHSPLFPEELIRKLQDQISAGEKYSALKISANNAMIGFALRSQILNVELEARDALLGEALKQLNGRAPNEQEMAAGKILVLSVHEVKQRQVDLKAERDQLLRSLEEARVSWLRRVVEAENLQTAILRAAGRTQDEEAGEPAISWLRRQKITTTQSS
jgi:hypothetical protein